ncbi:MAG: RNA polymerase sigma-54 factor, partial [Paraprevotella sp.]|nr:RNA polymerase sigma-54 factor [Paraprevotella sp.]
QLSALVDAEDKAHPLSDDRLAELMSEKGFPIARRTVAKYRGMMNIPSARMRR